MTHPTIPIAETYELRDLRPTSRGAQLQQSFAEFVHELVLPQEPAYDRHVKAQGSLTRHPWPGMRALTEEARRRGLWNSFLPSESGLTQVDYAGLAEISGWSQRIAPEAINGQAPDSGNMELLHLVGTAEQQDRWLAPLLEGRIRSAFAMTEPQVASSDATNIQTRIERDGDELVINGRKWWTSGILHSRCELLIVMGKTDPSAAPHQQQSMVLVPVPTEGLSVDRDIPVFNSHDLQGHAEIRLENVRVPLENLLGGMGEGFTAAQSRLGPGRIHHCMRAVGAAERALSLAVQRGRTRIAFGAPLIEQGMAMEAVAESRLDIEQARMLCLLAARAIDIKGPRDASQEVARAKAVVPRTVARVIDRAIQIHGGAGVSDDVPLARMYGWHRAMRIFDGPDEVHLRSIASHETRHSTGTVLR